MQGHRNPRADPPPPSGEEARLQRNAAHIRPIY